VVQQATRSCGRYGYLSRAYKERPSHTSRASLGCRSMLSENNSAVSFEKVTLVRQLLPDVPDCWETSPESCHIVAGSHGATIVGREFFHSVCKPEASFAIDCTYSVKTITFIHPLFVFAQQLLRVRPLLLSNRLVHLFDASVVSLFSFPGPWKAHYPSITSTDLLLDFPF
jgi:hypothetical protein